MLILSFIVREQKFKSLNTAFMLCDDDAMLSLTSCAECQHFKIKRLL